MLDFNSSKMKRNDVNIFGDLIDESLEYYHSVSEERNYLGVSLIGDQCDRRLAYIILGTKKDKTFNARVLRIFERGNTTEEMAKSWISKAGFRLADSQKEIIVISTSAVKVKGHCDGIITGTWRKVDVDFTFPMLWECKCLKHSKWTELSKNKLYAFNKLYYTQVQHYMVGLKLSSCLFMAVNADTMEFYFEEIKVDHAFVKESIERIRSIINTTQWVKEHGEKELMPRAYNSESYYECKYCDYRSTCWKISES